MGLGTPIMSPVLIQLDCHNEQNFIGRISWHVPTGQMDRMQV